MHDLTISGNTVTAGSPGSANNVNSPGLYTWIGRPARMSNIVFTGNTTTRSGAGPALLFGNIDGLTVTGNAQPLASGQLLSITNSTGVVTQ